MATAFIILRGKDEGWSVRSYLCLAASLCQQSWEQWVHLVWVNTFIQHVSPSAITSWLLLYLKLQSVTFFVQGEYSGAVIQTLLLLPALAETANTTRKYSSSRLCRVRRWIVGWRTVICFQASCKLVLAWFPERASCSFEHKHEVDINLMKELLCVCCSV